MPFKLFCVVTTFGLALFLPSLSTQAATGTIIIKNPNGKSLISLDPGAYSYAVRERLNCMRDTKPSDQYESNCSKQAITYLEIVNANSQAETGSASAGTAIGSIPIVGGVLLEVVNNDTWNQPGLSQVSSKSPLEAISEGGSGIELKKTGSITVHADEASRIVNIIKEIKARTQTDDTDALILAIPAELQRIVDEARANRNRVIIIIQGNMREGKKGLNAVNVKKA